MRINVEIDAHLMAEALKATGLRTKREVIEEGLRLLIRIHNQESIQSLRGTLKWEGSLEQMRRSRPF